MVYSEVKIGDLVKIKPIDELKALCLKTGYVGMAYMYPRIEGRCGTTFYYKYEPYCDQVYRVMHKSRNRDCDMVVLDGLNTHIGSWALDLVSKNEAPQRITPRELNTLLGV